MDGELDLRLYVFLCGNLSSDQTLIVLDQEGMGALRLDRFPLCSQRQVGHEGREWDSNLEAFGDPSVRKGCFHGVFMVVRLGHYDK